MFGGGENAPTPAAAPAAPEATEADSSKDVVDMDGMFNISTPKILDKNNFIF